MNAKGTRIKLCGLIRREDILAVNRWKPDYAGFVFAPGKRCLTGQEARELKKLLLPEIPAVGVFVNSPIEEILALSENKTIDLIQLHGDEDRKYILELKNRLARNVPVIKAIRVRQVQDMREAEDLPADFLLFDTYTKGLYGGSGKTFDWSMIPDIKKPFFLAGGIGASNIKQAMKTEAFCLDLSSSVETEGKKDQSKIKEIIQIIRSEQPCQKESLDSTEDSLSRKR
ncbi:phosphoribosylanthranilate isomerase [Lacrimispora saccharolytica]|uniref:N-(5'-phosphoribosyl)anthranilate isomerase n=1 Tax=Lacrimispora saccharolytica (strain ATCC 35040 / DSM 2544 / NRCC 2533 / WM1) TaxID=610130 RepID=D9RAV0_LACSW|nr:phosphoribosylanthranilate isomerase [Lacrimispora saccharolytica]ADL06147.1 Phosphoribosylanthranilate isomerase [[Clostridium] saccharolyticum WM1]QRV19741.1 phosphoribosylanthranilate isomerase [Lacrimispora saccharolytica]